MKNLPPILMSVLLATAGQLFLGAGMKRVGTISSDRLTQPGALILDVVRTPQVLLGLGLFGISALSWMLVLSRVSLSFAYPFVGLTYLMTTVFARFILKEQVPSLRWVGIALVISGVVVVGLSGPENVA